jgi:PrtD family type I secretion system ABC transporter
MAYIRPGTALLSALRACAGSLGLVFAYSCGYNLLLLAAPIYLLQIYDRVLSSRSADTLLMLTLIVAVTVVVGALLDAIRRSALSRVGAWLDDRMRPLVIAACLRHASRGDAARATEAYRDLGTMRQFIESSACPILFDCLWSPLFIGVLFLIHPLLGSVGFISILLMFGLALIGELATEDPVGRAGAALARSHGRLNAAAANIHLIRSMGMTDGAARRILADASEGRQDRDRAQRRGEIVMLVTKPVRALSQILVMGLAAWLVLQHDRSPAIIFASSLLFGRGLSPVEGALSGWKSLRLAMAAYRRVSGILGDSRQNEPSTTVAPELLEGPLVVDNVSLTLPGLSEPLLKSVSLRLEPGECLGVIGLSGSGKSMLGRLMAGAVTPTQGYVRLGGIEVRALQESGGAQYLGYMPQEIDLIGRSVTEVIGRLGQANSEEVVAAAKLAGLHELVMKLPNAYDSDIADGGVILLRAHRQRLGLARAVCGNPRLVVLDEPNASLDYVGEQMLFNAIEKMKSANTIVIVITHRMGILKATDKIAIMQGGAMAAFGSRDEIYARYLAPPQIDVRERVPARITPKRAADRAAASAKSQAKSGARKSRSASQPQTEGSVS